MQRNTALFDRIADAIEKHPGQYVAEEEGYENRRSDTYEAAGL